MAKVLLKRACQAGGVCDSAAPYVHMLCWPDGDDGRFMRADSEVVCTLCNIADEARDAAESALDERAGCAQLLVSK